MDRIQQIKQSCHPESYYPLLLQGSFGKATGNGWSQWNGLCPFHADKKAGSFVIHKDSGAFKCFSCGAQGGDIIRFFEQYNNISTKEAINLLWEAVK